MDTLLDTAPCGVLLFADDGTVLQANATLLGLLGHAREGVEGRHVEGLLTPGAQIFYQTHFFPLLKMRGKAEEVYLSLRAHDGADVPVLVNAQRREHEGATVNVCIVVPIRQRSRFEDELIQAKRAAEEASRARGRFLSMMSHDLRTPLSAISMAAHLLKVGSQGPVSEGQLHLLGRIEGASKYVMGLISDILTYSRLESGRAELRAEAVAVAHAVTKAEALVAHQMEDAGLTYTRGACDPTLAVQADPARFQQVLLNLLANAAKFTGRGGSVSVTAAPAGGRVLIHVSDTGRGIPADQTERIFDPFVRGEQGAGEPAPEGVGLGLAISREFARAMGGDLTVVSTVGEGSVFTVALPAVEPALHAAAA